MQKMQQQNNWGMPPKDINWTTPLAFKGQSRSLNMVPFRILGMVSY